MPITAAIALLLGAGQNAPPDADCLANARYLSVQKRPARQGATLAISPTRYVNFGTSEDPAKCLSDWQVSDPKAVTLASDRKSVTIAADAAPGTVVTISYLANGQRVSEQLRIVAKDAVVLTGIYGQTGLEGCQGPMIGEMEFEEGGAFSVTFQPFETYHDYWGRYRFDPASGALVLEVTGGNRIVAGPKIEGTARFDPHGKLRLEGIALGDVFSSPGPDGQSPWPARCNYIFG